MALGFAIFWTCDNEAPTLTFSPFRGDKELSSEARKAGGKSLLLIHLDAFQRLRLLLPVLLGERLPKIFLGDSGVCHPGLVGVWLKGCDEHSPGNKDIDPSSGGCGRCELMSFSVKRLLVMT